MQTALFAVSGTKLHARGASSNPGKVGKNLVVPRLRPMPVAHYAVRQSPNIRKWKLSTGTTE